MEYEMPSPQVSPRLITDSPQNTRGPTIFSRRIETYSTNSYESDFKDTALKKLKSIYATAADNVLMCSVVFPSSCEGVRLSNAVSKYAKNLSTVSKIEGLYHCGRDLGTSGIAGDFQGAFVAVNSALGYDKADSVSMRNVISDLKNVQ
jgi:hypothetical protein